MERREKWVFTILMVVLLIMVGLMLKNVPELIIVNAQMFRLLDRWSHNLLSNTNITCQDLVAPFTNSSEEKQCDISETTCARYPCEIINGTECEPLRNEFSQYCNEGHGLTLNFIEYFLLIGGVACVIPFLARRFSRDLKLASLTSPFAKLAPQDAKQLGNFLNKHGLWKEQPIKMADVVIKNVIAELTSFTKRASTLNL